MFAETMNQLKKIRHAFQIPLERNRRPKTVGLNGMRDQALDFKVQWDHFIGRFKNPGGPSLSVWGQWAHWFTVAAGLWGRNRGKDASSGAPSPDGKRWYWMTRLMECLSFFARR